MKIYCTCVDTAFLQKFFLPNLPMAYKYRLEQFFHFHHHGAPYTHPHEWCRLCVCVCSLASENKTTTNR